MNRRPHPYQGCALPLSYMSILLPTSGTPKGHRIDKRPTSTTHLATIPATYPHLNPTLSMERAAGIEPASSAWKAEVLPLNYARMREPPSKRLQPSAGDTLRHLEMVQGGGFEPPKLSRQIYSLIPLATREPLLEAACILYTDRCAVNNFSFKFTHLSAELKVQQRAGQKWSWREESNPRPADYKSAALPTELRQLRPSPKKSFSTP